jgi:hypothetical protein
MRRITKLEAVAMRGRLEEWRRPSDLRALLRELDQPHGFYSAGQGAMQPWREAFCAGEFATAVGASGVRLGEDPPDFYLRLGLSEFPFELIEVRDPATKMGAEFDALAILSNEEKKLPVEHFDPTEALNLAPDWIETAVAKKARKTYSPGTILAVKAHIMMFDSVDDEVTGAIERKVISHLSAFPEIWILVGGRFLQYR